MIDEQNVSPDSWADWPSGLVDVTERLVICELKPDDAHAYRDIILNCESGVDKELLNLDEEEFMLHMKSYIKYQYGFYGYGIWGIFFKGAINSYRDFPVSPHGEMLGIVGIKNGSASQVGELCYAILPEYRRKGFAYEACRASLEYGEECGFSSFEAVISHDNTASVALAQKLGINIIFTGG